MFVEFVIGFIVSKESPQPTKILLMLKKLWYLFLFCYYSTAKALYKVIFEDSLKVNELNTNVNIVCVITKLSDIEAFTKLFNRIQSGNDWADILRSSSLGNNELIPLPINNDNILSQYFNDLNIINSFAKYSDDLKKYSKHRHKFLTIIDSIYRSNINKYSAFRLFLTYIKTTIIALLSTNKSNINCISSLGILCSSKNTEILNLLDCKYALDRFVRNLFYFSKHECCLPLYNGDYMDDRSMVEQIIVARVVSIVFDNQSNLDEAIVSYFCNIQDLLIYINMKDVKEIDRKLSEMESGPLVNALKSKIKICLYSR